MKKLQHKILVYTVLLLAAIIVLPNVVKISHHLSENTHHEEHKCSDHNGVHFHNSDVDDCSLCDFLHHFNIDFYIPIFASLLFAIVFTKTIFIYSATTFNTFIYSKSRGPPAFVI